MATTRYTTFDGEVVSENRGGVMRDYVPDPLGSTVALLDSTQTQTDTFSYWPYGENRSRTGTNLTPFHFNGTGGFYQDSSSRIYAYNRYLSTSLAKWLTPIDYPESSGWASYIYDLNNPNAPAQGGSEKVRSNDTSQAIMDPLDDSCQYTINKHQVTYGWYCGPNGKGSGRPKNLPPAKPGQMGMDPLDDCCYAHDQCFQRNGCTVMHQSAPACRKCTKILCGCATKASCSTRRTPSWADCVLGKGMVNLYACGATAAPAPPQRRLH